MVLTIRYRIFLGVLFVVAGFVFMVNIALHKFGSELDARQVRLAMVNSVQAYLQYDEQRQQVLLSQAKLMVQAAHIKATQDITDMAPQALSEAFQSLEFEHDIDLVLLLDNTGRVQVSLGGMREHSLAMLDLPGVSRALDGQEIYTYWEYDHCYYRIALVPSHTDHQLLGVVVVGQRLDSFHALQGVQAVSDARVVMLTGDNYVSVDPMHLSLGERLKKKYKVVRQRFDQLVGDLGVEAAQKIWIKNVEQNIQRVRHDEVVLGSWHASYLPVPGIDSSLILLLDETRLAHAAKPLRLIVVLGSALAILLGAGVSWWIAGTISQPVLALTNATRAFGRGSFDHRVKRQYNDELGDLADAFNHMASDLQEGRKHLLDRKQAEEKMRYLTYYDALTGLPNRRFFKERLKKLVGAARSGGYQVAVLFIDIDDFRRINDSLGHSSGDQLLTQVSSRLKNCVRGGDVVALNNAGARGLSEANKADSGVHVSRLGGDEFTIILNPLYDLEAVRCVASRISDAFNQPFIFDGHSIVVTASIGIAMAPEDGEDNESLLKNADTAMYAAKNQGKNNFQFFNESMGSKGMERLQLEAELREALQNDELVVMYQPIANLQTQIIEAAEALVRWQHPKRGLLAPDSFVPLAEELGLIDAVDNIVLTKVCKQLQGWHQRGLPMKRISVNVSAQHFAKSNFVEELVNCVSLYDVPPRCLCMEITESAMMDDVDTVVANCQAVRAAGFTIAIDDFGTGYSSLSYLNRFPFDVLKIDRAFVAEIDQSGNPKALVTAIIAMAETLDLIVVAEGIENSWQQAYLKNQKVLYGQGYFLGKPMRASELAAQMYRPIACEG